MEFDFLQKMFNWLSKNIHILSNRERKYIMLACSVFLAWSVGTTGLLVY